MDTMESYMQKAIDLALKGSGFVGTQPLEGAVLVKNGKVIGQAYREEKNLIVPIMIQVVENATESTQGATLYMNIEPHLKGFEQVSLAKWIKATGIVKVHIGMIQPKAPEQEQAINDLKNAEIEVEIGPLQDACEELNEIYKHYSLFGVPFIFVKWAMTLDGKLASKTGDSKWISSEDSLRFVHVLRQRVAAIMVGEGTVRLDNPQLTTRLEGVKISNPIRIIVSKNCEIDEQAQVLKVDAATKTMVITSTLCPAQRVEMLLSLGVQVIRLEEKKGRIDFKDILRTLGEMEIDSLYIEGGSSLLGSAFESGVVQKVYAAVAPKIIGGREAITPVAGVGIERMRDAIVLKRVSHEVIGNDVIIKGYIEN